MAMPSEGLGELPEWVREITQKDHIVEHYSDWSDEYDSVVLDEYRYEAYSHVGKAALKWCLATEAEEAKAAKAAEAAEAEAAEVAEAADVVEAAAATAAAAVQPTQAEESGSGGDGGPSVDGAAAAGAPPLLVAGPLRVLDLGCGSGLSSLPFFDAGGTRLSVIGVDLSPEMLAEAAKLPFAALLCQSIEEPLPPRMCPDGSFAIITAVGVLEFVARPRALFTAMRAKLLPGGILGLGVPCVDEELGEEVGRELGVRVYEPDAVRALLADCGFEELEVARIHGYTCGDATVQYRAMTFRKPLGAVAAPPTPPPPANTAAGGGAAPGATTSSGDAPV
jgi:SAM-dependent methyltransferase